MRNTNTTCGEKVVSCLKKSPVRGYTPKAIADKCGMSVTRVHQVVYSLRNQAGLNITSVRRAYNRFNGDSRVVYLLGK